MIDEIEPKKKKRYLDGGPEMDDHLPHISKPTAQQQADIDEQQRQRAKSVGLQGTNEARLFARAHAVINEMDSIPRADWSEKQLNRYIDALTTVGKFNEAYELSGDEDHRKIWESIWKDDDERCDCPDTTEMTLKGNTPISTTYSRHFIRKRVFSLRDDKWVNLVTCNKCLHSNAITNAPPTPQAI